MEMFTNDNYNVPCHVIVKVEPNFSEDTFDYDQACTQTSQHNAVDRIKIEYDDEVDQSKVKMKANAVEYNSGITEPLICEVKIEYGAGFGHVTKLENHELECESSATEDIVTHEINIRQENGTPKSFTNIDTMCNSTTDEASNSIKTGNHGNIIQNDASEIATIACEKSDELSGEDYTSDDDVPLAETIQKAESSAAGLQQKTRIPDDSKLVKNDPRLIVDEKFSCQICPYQSTYKRLFQSHLKAHKSDKRYSCHMCNYIATRNVRLQEHIRVHLGEKPFSCDICQKSYRSKKGIGEHMLCAHLGKKPFTCDICQKTFSLKNQLANHIITHSAKKPYSCKVCHRTFSAKRTLSNHVNTHLPVSPFSCEVCHKTFRRKCDLACHMRIHTRENLMSCAICKKVCRNKRDLIFHMKTHSEEKEFACEICSKVCSTKSNLTTHKKLHTLKKPFSCEVCHKAFSFKSNLVCHMWKHPGQ